MTRKLKKALVYLTLIGLVLSAYSAFAQEGGRSPTQRSVRGRDDRTEAPGPQSFKVSNRTASRIPRPAILTKYGA